MCGKLCFGLLALAAALGIGAIQGEDDGIRFSGDGFADTLALRLELDWGPCPAAFAALAEQSSGRLRCAVVGAGDPRHEAEQLGLAHARAGGKVLDIEHAEGLPYHLLTDSRGMQPIPPVLGYDRVAYRLESEQVGLWIQRRAEPLSEGLEPERWVAVRVDTVDDPFPDYLPAR